MRTIKLHHPTGHSYWNKNKFTIELPSGKMFDLMPYHSYIGTRFPVLDDDYMIEVDSNGVYYQKMISSIGSGRVRVNGKPRILIIPSKEYDSIEYVGNPLVISNTLITDLIENGIC